MGDYQEERDAGSLHALAMDRNNLFAQVILFAFQAGFHADIAAASGVCKAVWEDDRLWERLVRMRPQHTRSAMTSVGVAGNASRLRWLLDRGASVDIEDFDGANALMCTVRSGHEAASRALLDGGAAVNYASKVEHYTALHEAASANTINTIGILVEYGANLNAVTRDGETPLHLACTGGHESAARALIDAGCNIHVRTTEALCTPLHDAARQGMARAIRALLERGAQVDSITSISTGQRTPLQLACARGKEEAALALLEGGADPNRVDDSGLGALHLVAAMDHAHMVRALVNNGARIDPQNREGQTPLDYAPSINHADVITALIAHGADPNALIPRLTRGGYTRPLSLACSTGSTAAALALIAGGARINGPIDFSEPPIRFACASRHDGTAIALIERGADLVLDMLGSEEPMPHESRLHDYVGKGLRCGILHFAAQYGRTAVAVAALDHGAPIDACTASGDTALRLATDMRQWDCALALLKRGANPNVAAGLKKDFPLADACRYGSVKCTRALLDHGADINGLGASSTSPTPLAIACCEGHVKIVRLMLDRGASLATHDSVISPLQHALK